MTTRAASLVLLLATSFGCVAPLETELGGEQVNWLLERGWAFTAVVGVSTWAHMGFYTLILLAGLQAIPRDLYEAAEIDGTTAAIHGPAKIARPASMIALSTPSRASTGAGPKRTSRARVTPSWSTICSRLA